MLFLVVHDFLIGLQASVTWLSDGPHQGIQKKVRELGHHLPAKRGSVHLMAGYWVCIFVVLQECEAELGKSFWRGKDQVAMY